MVVSPHWILLVDPFRNLLNAYKIILSEQGFHIETAESPREFSQKLPLRHYSVILTEYFPPFEETFIMIQKVKRVHPEAPIVMITHAQIDEATYEKLFEAGLDDIIFKPYSPEKILVHVRKALRQRDLIQRTQALFQRPEAVTTPDLNLHPRTFKKSLRQELKRSKRHKHPLSLLLLDFTAQEGRRDRLEIFFAVLAKMLRRAIREEDILGKENGSFSILLPETDQTGSQAVSERLSTLVRNHPPFEADKSMKILAKTLSIRSFSYPEKFAIPSSLKPVVEEVEREYASR
jgi:PleD family two-component response regulator